MTTSLSVISEAFLRRFQSASFFAVIVLAACLGYWSVLQHASRWHQDAVTASMTNTQIQLQAPALLAESEHRSSLWVQVLSDWTVRMPVHAAL